MHERHTASGGALEDAERARWCQSWPSCVNVACRGRSWVAPDFQLHLVYLIPGASWQAGEQGLGVLQHVSEQIIDGLRLKHKIQSTGMWQHMRAVPSCHVWLTFAGRSKPYCWGQKDWLHKFYHETSRKPNKNMRRQGQTTLVLKKKLFFISSLSLKVSLVYLQVSTSGRQDTQSQGGEVGLSGGKRSLRVFVAHDPILQGFLQSCELPFTSQFHRHVKSQPWSKAEMCYKVTARLRISNII